MTPRLPMQPIPSQLVSFEWSVAERSTDSSGTEEVVLTRLATDLLQWMNASWVVGVARCGPEVRAVCHAGDSPHPRTCLDFLAALLRRSGHDDEIAILSAMQRSDTLPHLICPIRTPRGAVALLAIGPRKRGKYSDEDAQFVRDLGAHLSGMLRNARLARTISEDIRARAVMEHGWEAAQEIQERLLPCRAPRAGGIEYYAQTERCGKLGGDFFGFVPRGDTQTVAVIGNVSPAGAAAGMMATALQSALRVLLEREGELPAIMAELNRIAWDLSSEDVLGTLLCLRIDATHDCVEYVSAGQELALIVRGSSAQVHRLDATGAALGLTRQSAYVQRTAQFGAGDVLVALTPGAAQDAGSIGELIRLIAESRHPIVRDPASYILDSTEYVNADAGAAYNRTATVIRFSDRGDSGTRTTPEKASIARAVAA